jgi:hypothetical protein
VNSEDGLVTEVYSTDRKDLDIEECMLQCAVVPNNSIEDKEKGTYIIFAQPLSEILIFFS